MGEVMAAKYTVGRSQNGDVTTYPIKTDRQSVEPARVGSCAEDVREDEVLVFRETTGTGIGR